MEANELFSGPEARLTGLKSRLGLATPTGKGAVREEKSDTFGFSWLAPPSSPDQMSASSLLATLISDSNYFNPTATRLMREAFELRPFETSPLRCQGTGDDYLALREAQNLSWAESKTKEGTCRAREGQHSEAIALYTQALQLAPRYANARIARGCSFANMLQYDDAIRDFRLVLNQDASNEVVGTYLAHTMEKRDKARLQHDGRQHNRPAYLLVAEEDSREHSPTHSSGDDEKAKSDKKRKKHKRKKEKQG